MHPQCTLKSASRGREFLLAAAPQRGRLGQARIATSATGTSLSPAGRPASTCQRATEQAPQAGQLANRISIKRATGAPLGAVPVPGPLPSLAIPLAHAWEATHWQARRRADFFWELVDFGGFYVERPGFFGLDSEVPMPQ